MNQTTDIAIPYGHELLKTAIPAINYAGMAIPNEPLSSVSDEREEVERALRQPIASPALAQLVKPEDTVAIIVSDYTRPTPSGLILEPVLTQLQENGVKADQITIIVACGLHEPSPENSLKVMLGQAILERYKIVNHDADDLENLVFVGTTSYGIPVKINRIVANADVRISISSIDPHRFAGWSGGAKNILPGVAARETVNAHHILLQHPDTRLGITAGNLFREQLEEAAQLAKLNFIVNVILTPQKKIAYAVAGHPQEAHHAGVEYARQRMRVEISSQAELVIASPGGAPRDGEFWQTEGKCFGPVADAVRDNGTLIVAAQCPKGIGNEEFAHYLRTMNVTEMKAALEQGPFSMALAKAYKFAQLAEKVDIYLVTEGVTAPDFGRIPVSIFSSLDAAVSQALSRNPKASALVVPDAAGVVLHVKKQP